MVVDRRRRRSTEVACGANELRRGRPGGPGPGGRRRCPGGFAIGRRKMKGIVPTGCCARGASCGCPRTTPGILILNDVDGAAPGHALTDALGIEPDVVFDVAVEANRPDAWCMAGVARDLAARLGCPSPSRHGDLVADRRRRRRPARRTPGGRARHGRVDDLELCPRFTARVLTGVVVGPSPRVARPPPDAGRHAPDQQRGRRLQLRDARTRPAHPPLRPRPAGRAAGCVVRRAEPGEPVTTLDGVDRTLGRPGPGLGDTGQDCLICDADRARRSASAGSWAAPPRRSARRPPGCCSRPPTSCPMAIARTSKRLDLRTEASARFERGCDPAGIDRAAERFCELLALTAGSGLAAGRGGHRRGGRRARAPGDDGAAVPGQRPAGHRSQRRGHRRAAGSPRLAASPTGPARDPVAVVVPTLPARHPPAPMGEADVAEEVARTYGYARLPRRTPSWPQPGRLTDYQRERRRPQGRALRPRGQRGLDAGLRDRGRPGGRRLPTPYIEVTNPLVESERFLRSSMAPGPGRAPWSTTPNGARATSASSRSAPSSDRLRSPVDDGIAAESTERLCARVRRRGATTPGRPSRPGGRSPMPSGWSDWVMEQGPHHGGLRPGAPRVPVGGGAGCAAGRRRAAHDAGHGGRARPDLRRDLRSLGPDGRPRRVGWLDLDLGALLDPAGRPVARSRPCRSAGSPRRTSTSPSSSPRRCPPRWSSRRWPSKGASSWSLCSFSTSTGGVAGGRVRSLAFRLRFCALDRTLTDEEIGALRASCIAGVEKAHRATLR